MTAREQAINALLAKLAATAEFATVGRRNRSPETIASVSTPALMLVEASEEYKRPSPSVPPIRTLRVSAIIYYDVGDNENAIPASVINPLLDGFDAALVPDDPISGRCTLGGLVYSVLIEGEMLKAPGDVTGKGLAVVPIAIVLP